MTTYVSDKIEKAIDDDVPWQIPGAIGCLEN